MNKYIVLYYLLFSLFFTAIAFADDGTTGGAPSTTVDSSTPGGMVANLYTFALGAAGVLALGVITYGAIAYTLAAGNPSKQSEAKSWITGALWGLLLLFGAVLILKAINPDIIKLTDPTLTSPTTTGVSGAPH